MGAERFHLGKSIAQRGFRQHRKPGAQQLSFLEIQHGRLSGRGGAFMAYSDKVVDHYNNPRNVGSMPKEDPNVGTGLVGAPECGDVMKLQMKINPDRKSTRLNSSHSQISYAVFCLKKKKNRQ